VEVNFSGKPYIRYQSHYSIKERIPDRVKLGRGGYKNKIAGKL
jgi:hypothetical protein